VFVAMNRFQTNPGKGPEFEEIWRTRETYLDQVPGFLHFTLLRGDQENEYISHSTWESREAFLAWTQSEAFRKGHAQGSLMGVLAGPPQISVWESVLTQGPGEPLKG
jgi:heme-degrading monooxygenase HmoA